MTLSLIADEDDEDEDAIFTSDSDEEDTDFVNGDSNEDAFTGEFADGNNDSAFEEATDDVNVPDYEEFSNGDTENEGIFEDVNTLSLDDDEEEETSEDIVVEDVAETAKVSEEAKTAYNATFDGEEQLEHSLFSLSSKLQITSEMIKLEYLIPSNFKKQSRTKTIIGLNGIVSQWGVINPVHVMRLEDNDAYLVLDGLRRIYAAMKNGMEEVECRVWDFEDKAEGKKLANVISLMINRTEKYRPIEQWNMMKILEGVNDLSPVLLEYLLQLEAGQAMKLKDVMLCESDYYEIRDKLIMGEIDIESAYKKLCNERKKENRLQREDNTAIENTVSDEAIVPADKRRLSDDEVHDLLELANNDVSGSSVEELDMTDEIRGNDKYQTTDERHPVDQAIRQGTFMRGNFHCRCCGRGGVQWLGVLVFHHAIPVYAGGPDTIENGLTLCQNCHMTLHNYIMGKVQANFEDMSEGEVKTFKNIFKYGNIALNAVKSKGIDREKLAKLDRTGTQHAYPDANIKENTLLFSQAQSALDDARIEEEKKAKEAEEADSAFDSGLDEFSFEEED